MAKVDDVQADGQRRMNGAIENLQRELTTISTGRASTALVENISVDYYGSSMPLNQIASITVPEARMIIIQPWDKGAFEPIEKSILKADLGLNPASDGAVIRLAIPALNEDRRKEMAKQINKFIENDKVAIRNVRRDIIDQIKKLTKDKEISQDDERRIQESLQKLTDQMIAKAETIGKAKEAEVLEV
ncbi:MAG: ribosome recycling factor [SAR202 cluster bacterium]|nr:ribosome recycling factor [SAR202 cluster bacterium]|tara:strand:- start:334 stop:897 length:564 start_codon:yes stop_codon:yes gene_type:complete